jgi:hypothetical protein
MLSIEPTFRRDVGDQGLLRELVDAETLVGIERVLEVGHGGLRQPNVDTVDLLIHGREEGKSNKPTKTTKTE